MKNLINVLLYVLLALLVVTISVMIYKKFKAPADTQTSGETTEQTYSDTSNTQALPFSAEDSMVLGLTGELPNQVGPEAESNMNASSAPVNVAPVVKPVANHESATKTENHNTSSVENSTKSAETKSSKGSTSTAQAMKTEAKHETTKSTTKESKAVVKQSDKKSSEKTVSTASKGHYFVVSGSFLVPSNAEKQVSKLKKLGFFNATKKIFNNSSSYSAVAGQYDSEAAARASLNKLKSKGEEGFIKKN